MKWIFALLSFLIYSSSTLAFNGFYLGFFGGVVQPVKVSKDTAVSGAIASIEHKFGIQGGIHAGYRINNFRIEAQALGGFAKLDKVTYNTKPSKTLPFPSSTEGIDGKSTFMGGFINLYYDYLGWTENNGSGAVPYIGVGVGMAHIESKLKLTSTCTTEAKMNGRCTKIVCQSGICKDTTFNDSSPAYQAIVGIQNYWDSDSSIFFEYRFTSINKIDSIDASLNNHSINVGFSAGFYA